MKQFWVRAAAILSLILVGCTSSVQQSDRSLSEAKGNTNFLLMISGNRHLELDTCGCEYYPLGGGPRELSYLGQLKSQYPNLKTVSIGVQFTPLEFDFKTKKITKELKLIWQKKREFMAKMLAKLSPGAVGVLADDLMLGVSDLQKWGTDLKLPLVATNLYSKKTKKPLFATHLEWNTPLGKAIVVSVSTPGSAKTTFNKDVDVLPYEKELAKLPLDNYNLVVLMSNLDGAKTAALTQKIKKPLIVLGGPGAKENEYVNDQFDATAIRLSPYLHGRSVVTMEIERRGTDLRLVDTLAQPDIKTYRDQYEKELAELGDANPSRKAYLQSAIESFKLRGVEPNAGGFWYQVKNTELNSQFDDAKSPISALIEDMKLEVKKCASATAHKTIGGAKSAN